MEQIWKIVAEILVEPGDMESGLTKGFMNVITWADSAEGAAEKLAKYIQRFHWQLISVEDACAVKDEEEYKNEEIAEMLVQTRRNPNAIILGTFHGYKET